MEFSILTVRAITICYFVVVASFQCAALTDALIFSTEALIPLDLGLVLGFQGAAHVLSACLQHNCLWWVMRKGSTTAKALDRIWFRNSSTSFQ